MHQPHDHLFRAIFAAPPLAASLLRHVVPAALAAIVDWDTVQPAPPALLDRELAAHEPDLLFTAPVRGGGEILLLLEHKLFLQPPVDIVSHVVPLWGIGPFGHCNGKFHRYENAYGAALRKAGNKEPRVPSFYNPQP